MVTAWVVTTAVTASGLPFIDGDSATINDGGTLTWDIANADGGIDSDGFAVNAGGKLVIDVTAGTPGARRVDINTGKAITVAEGGQLLSLGTAASRVSIVGEGNAPNHYVQLNGGKLYATFTDISGFRNGIYSYLGGQIELHDCTVSAASATVGYSCIFYGSITMFAVNTTLSITASAFAHKGIFEPTNYKANVRLINCTMTHSAGAGYLVSSASAINVQMEMTGCTYNTAPISSSAITETGIDIDLRIYEASVVTVTGIEDASISVDHASLQSDGMMLDTTNYMRVPAYLSYAETGAAGTVTIYCLQKTAYWPSGLAVASRSWKYWSDSTQAATGDNQQYSFTASKFGYTVPASVTAWSGANPTAITLAAVTTITVPYDVDLGVNLAVIVPADTLEVSLAATLTSNSTDVLHKVGYYKTSDDSRVKSFSHLKTMTADTVYEHSSLGFSTSELSIYNYSTMNGEYYVRYTIQDGTPEVDSVILTERYYMGEPSGDTAPTLTGLLFNPTSPTTNQDCGVTVTYKDVDGDAPVSATIELTDSLANTLIYDFTATPTTYSAGVQYRSNIPAGKLAVGTADYAVTFVNANGYDQETGSIVISAESVLSTHVDLLSSIHDLLEDKAQTNYQLIKNSQGYGALNTTQVRRYRPTDEGHLPCVWMEEVDTEAMMTGNYADCEDLSKAFYSTTFDVWVVGTHRTELTYNLANFKGWEAINLITDIAMRILRENQNYTDKNNSNLKVYNLMLKGKSQLEEGEVVRISKDAIGYRLRYKAMIQVSR